MELVLDPYHLKNPPVSLKFDLQFIGLHAMFNYRECPKSPWQEKRSKNIASEYLEQYGKIKGTLSIDDTNYEINALGKRKHSWGVRNWIAPKRWIWLTCQFDNEFAFGIAKLTVSEEDIDVGFVHLKDRTHPIKKVQIHTAYSTHHESILYDLSIITTSNKIFDVQASVKDKIHIPFENGKMKSMIYENLANCSYKNHTGYGIAEYLIKQ